MDHGDHTFQIRLEFVDGNVLRRVCENGIVCSYDIEVDSEMSRWGCTIEGHPPNQITSSCVFG